MSLKDYCQKLIAEKPETRLVLDLENKLNIPFITLEDKAFLEVEFKKVKMINLTRTCLTSLRNFPYLPKLKCLILTNNSLTDTEMFHLKNLPKLSSLRLDYNKIRSVNAFHYLAGIPELMHISFEGNTVNENMLH